MNDDMPKTIAAWRFHPNKADEWIHGGWSLDHDRKTVSYTRTSELEVLRAENARLRQLVISAAKRMNRSAAIIMRDLDDPRILRAALETKGAENDL